MAQFSQIFLHPSSIARVCGVDIARARASIAPKPTVARASIDRSIDRSRFVIY